MSLLNNQIKLLCSTLNKLDYCEVVDTIIADATDRSLVIVKLNVNEDFLMEFVKLHKCYCNETQQKMTLSILTNIEGVVKLVLKITASLNDRVASHAVNNLLVLVETFMVVEDCVLPSPDEEPNALKRLCDSFRALLFVVPDVLVEEVDYSTHPNKDIQVEAKLTLKSNMTVLTTIASEFNKLSETNMTVHYDEVNPCYVFIHWDIKSGATTKNAIALASSELNMSIIKAHIIDRV